MEKLKDFISQFHNDNIFIPTRSIKVSGEVNLAMYDNLLANLHALDSDSGTINLFINSEGGDNLYCKAIFDLIKGCKNFVRGMVYGEACSSASIFLQACDERLMSPNSYLMIHYGDESTAGHPLNKKRWDEKLKKDTDWMIDLYYQKIKEKKKRFTKKAVADMILFDTILSPKESIDFGLVDSIKEHF